MHAFPSTYSATERLDLGQPTLLVVSRLRASARALTLLADSGMVIASCSDQAFLPTAVVARRLQQWPACRASSPRARMPVDSQGGCGSGLLGLLIHAYGDDPSGLLVVEPPKL